MAKVTWDGQDQYLVTSPLTLVCEPLTGRPGPGESQQKIEYGLACGTVSDVHATQSSASWHIAQQSCQLLTWTGMPLKDLPLYV
jgi:hypothetical protein